MQLNALSLLCFIDDGIFTMTAITSPPVKYQSQSLHLTEEHYFSIDSVDMEVFSVVNVISLVSGHCVQTTTA